MGNPQHLAQRFHEMGKPTSGELQIFLDVKSHLKFLLYFFFEDQYNARYGGQDYGR